MTRLEYAESTIPSLCTSLRALNRVRRQPEELPSNALTQTSKGVFSKPHTRLSVPGHFYCAGVPTFHHPCSLHLKLFPDGLLRRGDSIWGNISGEHFSQPCSSLGPVYTCDFLCSFCRRDIAVVSNMLET